MNKNSPAWSRVPLGVMKEILEQRHEAVCLIFDLIIAILLPILRVGCMVGFISVWNVSQAPIHTTAVLDVAHNQQKSGKRGVSEDNMTPVHLLRWVSQH